jgi:hypothetical protein
MFELNVGTTPHQLTPADFRHLAEMTEGYSGSDIAVIVRDALMQPVRKVLSATHFRYVQHTAEDGAEFTKLTPCSPGAEGAMEKTWADVETDELLEPLLTVGDFERAIQINRPTVSLADIQKHIDFTNESGECSYESRKDFELTLQVEMATSFREWQSPMYSTHQVLRCTAFWILSRSESVSSAFAQSELQKTCKGSHWSTLWYGLVSRLFWRAGHGQQSSLLPMPPP